MATATPTCSQKSGGPSPSPVLKSQPQVTSFNPSSQLCLVDGFEQWARVPHSTPSVACGPYQVCTIPPGFLAYL